MEIRILGCSGGIGPGLRTTSLLLDGSTLIDAGTGVGELTLEEMAGLRRVCLTHAHLDHVCGLAFIADTLFEIVEQPIVVYAEAATLAILREHLFNNRLWPDFTQLRWNGRPVLRFETLPPAVPLALPGVRLRAFPVIHTVPAVGFTVEADGGAAFAFSGDTGGGAALWDALNALPRLDHLMIEVAFPDEDEALGRIAKHLTPSILADELGRLRHRPMLHLTHLKPGVEAVIRTECDRRLGDWPHRYVTSDDRIVC